MFATKYPSFAALLALLAGAGKVLAVQGESLIQKLEGEAVELPSLLAFLPQAGSLGSEIVAIKGNTADIEAAAEYAVTQLAFSSEKAQAIIAAAFPVAETAVTLLGQVKTLVAAI